MVVGKEAVPPNKQEDLAVAVAKAAAAAAVPDPMP